MVIGAVVLLDGQPLGVRVDFHPVPSQVHDEPQRCCVSQHHAPFAHVPEHDRSEPSELHVAIDEGVTAGEHTRPSAAHPDRPRALPSRTAGEPGRLTICKAYDSLHSPPESTTDRTVRVALDTNLWSALAQQHAGSELASHTSATGVTVVVPPATILEAARTPNADIRRPLLHLLGDSRFENTRTEAAMEAEEWVAAARLRRPMWIRRFTRQHETERLDRFWTREVPAAASQGADWLHERVQHSNDELEAIVTQLRDLRDRAPQGWRLGERVDAHMGEPEDPGSPMALGLDAGEEVEVWRLDNANLWWHHLVDRLRYVRHMETVSALAGREPPTIDTTFIDWVQPWVLIDRIAADREAWNTFWYRDVTSQEVPRAWIRALLPYAQTDHSLRGTGTGGDQQLSTYLLDVDLFLTCDQRFVRALEVIRPYSPSPLPTILALPSRGQDQIELVLNAIGAELKTSRESSNASRSGTP